MLSRRELIGSAVAASALSGLPTGIGATVSKDGTATCIVDRALQGSTEMIARFDGERLPVHVFSGDPGGVWMHRLEPLLRRHAVTIAGYTSASTLFCLQYLSRDYGLALKAYADGARALGAFADGESDIADLIDSRSRHQRGPMTWLLAPRRG
jgi:hypothetical protein